MATWGRVGPAWVVNGRCDSAVWCDMRLPGRAAMRSYEHRPQIATRPHTMWIPGNMATLVTTLLVIFGLPMMTNQGRVLYLLWNKWHMDYTYILSSYDGNVFQFMSQMLLYIFIERITKYHSTVKTHDAYCGHNGRKYGRYCNLIWKPCSNITLFNAVWTISFRLYQTFRFILGSWY